MSYTNHPAYVQGQSYESPCGVMSLTAGHSSENGTPLRIPMRGYEVLPRINVEVRCAVTNPHAGL